MNKKIRAILSVILTAAMLITFLPSMSNAAEPKVGDAIGDVLYSDITAYINDNAIPTSVIKGKTLVVVEDLAKYGFDVKWDSTARTLKVEQKIGKKFNPIPTTKDTTNKPGTFKEKYYYTDIKTYLSGELVESYAIKGVTLINFELLAKYGKLNWDGSRRELRIMTADIYAGSPKATLPDNVSTVSIVKSNIEKSENITKDEIERMVKSALAQTDFYDIIKNNQTVVLKPNLVQLSMPPAHDWLPKEVNGITTDWRVTAAVAKQVRALNPDGKIYVMECSSGGATKKIMEYYNYTKEYIPEVDEFLALESDCGDWRDYNSPLIEKVALPDGRLHKEYYFNKILYNADVLISIPVLKTSSGGVVVTASIKNVSLGAPPGNIYNVSPTNNTKFDMVSHEITDGDLDNWIYDYYMCKPITFAVVDGLQGYQHGPNAFSDGSHPDNLMNMRIIMAGSDPIAIDSVCSYVMGWNPSGIGYLNHFKDSGIGATEAARIYVCGEKVDELRKPFAINNPELGGVPLKKSTPPEFDVEINDYSGVFYITVKSKDAVKVEVYTDKMVRYGIMDNKSYSFSADAKAGKIKVIVYDDSFNKSEKEIDLNKPNDIISVKPKDGK